MDRACTTTDQRGDQRLGVNATGKINRKDFGVSYNKVLDKGGLMLGEDVQLELEIEGVSKTADKPAEPKNG